MSKKEGDFLPFYERFANCIPSYVAGRVALSAFLGFAFLALHQLINHSLFAPGGVKDWSWFLALLISIEMLCLYYATHTLGAVCQELDTRLPSGDIDDYRKALVGTLSDARFVRAGIFFGLLNCLVGWALGLPYGEASAQATIVVGYFLAGFVGGMAVWGIYGVVRLMNAASTGARRSFDFTSPDNCGGTGFLGDALIVFASVTLVAGVMISIYVLNTWPNVTTWHGTSLRGFWILFPYACSLIALIGPAVPIARELRKYKIAQEASLKKNLNEIRTRLEDRGSAAERKDLREDYDFLQNRRKDLHGMRTWPFGLGANLKYISIFAANVSVHAFSGAAKAVAGWFQH